VAAKYQGKYISHMRSEGNRLLEAFDELIRISREAGIPAEVYHIKAAGQQNWPKIDTLLSRTEAAQKEGLKITANMYTHTAGGNWARRLSAAMDCGRRLPSIIQTATRPSDTRKNCRGSQQRQ
jgi:N-acyl-D-aspartate/D-glutamate deacylase